MFSFALMLAIIAVTVFVNVSHAMVSRMLLALSIFVVGVGGVIAALIYVGDPPVGVHKTSI